jgi:DNA-directed RNA polymerase specialized sigma24 family protein
MKATGLLQSSPIRPSCATAADLLAETLKADLNRSMREELRDRQALFAEVIEASVSSLNAGDREIIELRAWEHLTPAEIAEVIGMKPGAIRVRLHRIRSAIGAQLIAAGCLPPDRLGCAAEGANPPLHFVPYTAARAIIVAT